MQVLTKLQWIFIEYKHISKPVTVTPRNHAAITLLKTKDGPNDIDQYQSRSMDGNIAADNVPFPSFHLQTQ